MKTNGNEPISPAMDNNNYQGIDRMELRYTGLTKREHMAIEFTKALLSNPNYNHNINSSGTLIMDAILSADELIKQLNAE